MTLRTLVLLISTFSIPSAQSFESHLAAGIALTIERIPEPVAVDGVSLTLQRATGAGVPELARRIEALWRSQGSEVRALQQGIWTMRSRLMNARLEVVQWRVGTAPELLWSTLDTARPVQPVPDAGLSLPAGCSWGRSVSGRSGRHLYLQRSASCRVSMPALSSHLQRALPTQGWRLRSTSERALLIDRAGIEGLLSLSANPREPVTWLSWLRVEAAP